MFKLRYVTRHCLDTSMTEQQNQEMRNKQKWWIIFRYFNASHAVTTVSHGSQPWINNQTLPGNTVCRLKTQRTDWQTGVGINRAHKRTGNYTTEWLMSQVQVRTFYPADKILASASSCHIKSKLARITYGHTANWKHWL